MRVRRRRAAGVKGSARRMKAVGGIAPVETVRSVQRHLHSIPFHSLVFYRRLLAALPSGMHAAPVNDKRVLLVIH